MKILFVTSRPLEANVSSSIRKRATIHGLLSAGAEVTLLTTEAQQNASNYDASLDLKGVRKVTIPSGVMYSAFSNKQNQSSHPSLLSAMKKKLKMKAREVYFKFNIYDSLKGSIHQVRKVYGLDEHPFDAVISVSDPKSSHLLAWELIKQNKVKYNKYIQIWGDPMFADITNKTFGMNYLIKKEEKKLLSYADFVFYVSPLTCNEQAAIFPEYAGKMGTLLPPYLNENIYPNSGKITKIGYFGDYHSHIRNLRPLYNAVKQTNLKFVVCGNSDEKLESTDNIDILGRQTFETVKKLESEVDVLVHLSNRRGRQIPGKIYQYMGTNKPILFILDGHQEETRQFFERFDRCVFCENNEQAIKEALIRLEQSGFDKKTAPVKELNAKSIGEQLISSILKI